MPPLTTDMIRGSVKAVKDMPPDEQPREKLQLHGAETLSNAELLAILMRTGTRSMNVIDTARSVLDLSGGIHALAGKCWRDLRQLHGVGDVKAITLIAAFELARRVNSPEPVEKVMIRSPDAAYEYFGPKLRDLRQEVFVIGYLSPSKRLLSYEKISIGGKMATIVDPAEVLRRSIMNDAHSIILFHNHPSGNTQASQSDISLTRRIAEAGRLLGIIVEDHIIIAGHNFLSMRSKGLMG